MTLIDLIKVITDTYTIIIVHQQSVLYDGECFNVPYKYLNEVIVDIEIIDEYTLKCTLLD